MKRSERKKKKDAVRDTVYKKSVYDLIGVGPEVIANEVKIIIIGDYLVQFYNHNGIIDITDELIKINTKKSIYNIYGEKLKICSMSDEEVDIRGRILSIVSE